jgi:hypothetical protein
MSDLPTLFDFKHNKPADLWAGRMDIQLGLEYRLYRGWGKTGKPREGGDTEAMTWADETF